MSCTYLKKNLPNLPMCLRMGVLFYILILFITSTQQELEIADKGFTTSPSKQSVFSCSSTDCHLRLQCPVVKVLRLSAQGKGIFDPDGVKFFSLVLSSGESYLSLWSLAPTFSSFAIALSIFVGGYN